MMMRFAAHMPPANCKHSHSHRYRLTRWTPQSRPLTGTRARSVQAAASQPRAFSSIGRNITSAASKLNPLQLLHLGRQAREFLPQWPGSQLSEAEVIVTTQPATPRKQQQKRTSGPFWQLLPVSEAAGHPSTSQDQQQHTQDAYCEGGRSSSLLGDPTPTPSSSVQAGDGARVVWSKEHSDRWCATSINDDNDGSVHMADLGFAHQIFGSDPDDSNTDPGESSSRSSRCTAAKTLTYDNVPWSSSASSNGSSSLHTTQFPDLHSLKFSRHLSTASSSVAPFSARLESLSWLLLQTKQLQRKLMLTGHNRDCDSAGAAAVPAAASQAVQPVHLVDGSGAELHGSTTLNSNDSYESLQHIYLLGQVVLDVGSSDVVNTLNRSHLLAVTASLDYAAVLDRYLDQHKEVLGETFWSEIEDNELQATALHVSTSLKTRHTVHSLLVERLLSGLGQEGTAAAAAAAGYSGQSSSMILPQLQTSPLAAAITNNNIIINKPEVSNSNSSNCNVMQAAAPTATSSSSNSAHQSGLSSGSSLVTRLQGAFTGFGVVVVFIWSLAVKTSKLLLAVVMLVRNVTVQLLMLKSLAAAGKAAAAVAGSQLQQLATGRVMGSTNTSDGNSRRSTGRVNHPTTDSPGVATAECLPVRDTVAAADPETAAASQYSWVEVPANLQLAAPLQVFPVDPAAGGCKPLKSAAAVIAASAPLGLLSAEPLKNSRKGPDASLYISSNPSIPSGRTSQQASLIVGDKRSISGQGRAQQQREQRQDKSDVRSLIQNSKLLYQLWTPEAAAWT